MFQHKTSRLLWMALICTVTLFRFGGASVHAQSCNITPTGTFTGSITTSDPTETPRLFRDATPSDCNGKEFPGTSGTAAFHFDQYTFTNNAATAACVQVTFTTTAGTLFTEAYLNSFNPANIETNYVGDIGGSPGVNAPASYSFFVPAGASFVVVVNETTANAGGSYSFTVGCTAAPPTAPGQVLISEFRLAGPGTGGTGSARDEFIELYNNTDSAVGIGGLVLRAYDPNFNDPGDGADFVQTIPSNTILPARGHFLIGDNGDYTLGGYAALDFDTSTLFGGDFFIDNEGLQLINPAGTIIYDSVGFSGSGGRAGEGISYAEGTPLTRRSQTSPTVQYSYVRQYDAGTGRPVDTNNNAADFALVSVTGAALPAATTGTVPTVLGAPGPQDLASPLPKINSQIIPSLIEPTSGSTLSPNRVRDANPVTNGANGTLSIRRRFTNQTGVPVTSLRFRVVDITTLNTPNPGGAQTDMRALTSGAAVVSPATSVGVSLVNGTTLEQPPTQTLGGGLNASLSVALPAGGLTSTSGGVCPTGATCSADVQFLLGVNGAGRFRFFIFQEALP